MYTHKLAAPMRRIPRAYPPFRSLDQPQLLQSYKSVPQFAIAPLPFSVFISNSGTCLMQARFANFKFFNLTTFQEIRRHHTSEKRTASTLVTILQNLASLQLEHPRTRREAMEILQRPNLSRDHEHAMVSPGSRVQDGK